MRDLTALHRQALGALRTAANAACAAADCETALLGVSTTTHGLLGDPEAHLQPGALKPDQHQFSVAGYFMITPDAKENLLIAEVGFPAEQHRLRIDVNYAHPGWVVEHRRPLIIPDTEQEPEFRQILKTARMGSAMYAPMFWRGTLVGQLVQASQARHTYGEADLEILLAFAELSAALYMAHGGPAFLAGVA